MDSQENQGSYWKKLWLLFYTFAKIAALVVGGGYAILPVVEETFSRKNKLISSEELLDMMALVQTIPGIIAAYRYSMATYIMAENPTIAPTEAIERSKALMDGRKGDLFCLDLSFFGWALLTVLTAGIGALWLTPYMAVSRAAFYRSLPRSMGDRAPNGWQPQSGDRPDSSWHP